MQTVKNEDRCVATIRERKERNSGRTGVSSELIESLQTNFQTNCDSEFQRDYRGRGQDRCVCEEEVVCLYSCVFVRKNESEDISSTTTQLEILPLTQRD